MLKLPREFRQRLNFEAAVREELARPPDRLPSRVAEKAVEGHEAEYAERVEGLCASGFEPTRDEIVWMPKASLSYRPLSAVPLPERVVYRALSNDFRANVGELDAFRQTQDTFESSLIADDEDELIQYVVIADVTSFYRYVSHSLLEQRIVETTARADLAEAVRAFLDFTMNNEVGLPQNLGPSDLFADVVVTSVERRLLRAGIATTRFNDDFRLGTRTLSSAREALELLQQEIHAVGLTLNESKTLILKRERFVEHLGQLMEDDYEEETGDVPAPTPDVINDVISDLGDALQLSADRQPRTRLEEARALRQVRRILRRLTRWSNPSAVTFGRQIINRHPSLTQNFARYARELADSGYSDQVAQYLEEAFPRLVLTDWQELWLLEPLLSRRQHQEAISGWIQTRLEDADAPNPLRSRALLTAARGGLVDKDLTSRFIDTLPPAAQPDAIAAFAAASQDLTDIERLGGLPDSELARWIFEAAFLDWKIR